MKTAIRCSGLGLLLVAAAGSAAMAAPLAFVRGGVVDGTFVVTHITDPLAGASDTNAFDELRGHSIRFVIAFDRIDREVSASLADGGKRRILTTNPARVHFLGDPTGYLQEVIAPTLNCAMQITLRENASGTAVLEAFDMAEAQASQYFGFKGAVSVRRSQVWWP